MKIIMKIIKVVNDAGMVEVQQFEEGNFSISVHDDKHSEVATVCLSKENLEFLLHSVNWLMINCPASKTFALEAEV